MATPFHCEIVAVDREVWAGEVDLVVARTTEGELGVLNGHAPLLGELVDGGVVRLVRDNAETRVAVHGGFLSVTDDGVQVLAEMAELGSEIDVTRAERALQAATGAHSEDPERIAAARRAIARLRAAGQDI